MKVILSRGRIKKKYRVNVRVLTRNYFTLMSTYMSRCTVLTYKLFFAPNVTLVRRAQS